MVEKRNPEGGLVVPSPGGYVRDHPDFGVGTLRRRQVLLRMTAPPRELSPNARKHWAKKAHVVADYREECGWDAREQCHVALTPPITARVTFVVPDHRRRDLDNLAASLKPMWDGLVDAKVLPDDRATVIVDIGYSLRVEKGQRYVMVLLTETAR